MIFLKPTIRYKIKIKHDYRMIFLSKNEFISSLLFSGDLTLCYVIKQVYKSRCVSEG